MKINDAAAVISAAARADDTVIMEGLHGIGKSNVVKQVAAENNYELVELFLSHQEVGDIIGIPKLIEENGESLTTWSKPIWLQRMIDAAWPREVEYNTLSFQDESFQAYVNMKLNPSKDTIVNRTYLSDLYNDYYKTGTNELLLVTNQMNISCSEARLSLLFLDELNRAPIDVRQSALQLVLEKEIHEHSLPRVQGQAAIIVAAINPSDGYQVDELDPALLDRFLFIELEPDLKAWLDWANKNEIDQVIKDFLIEHPDRIHYTPEDGGVGVTPRSWAKLSNYTKNFETTPRAIHSQIIKGKIGQHLAGQFLSYYNNYAHVLKFEDLVKMVAKEAKKTKDPMIIAKKLKKVVDKQQAIAKTELAERMLKEYLGSKTAEEALPMLSYFYSLDMEIWTSFIKKIKESDMESVATLAKLDSVNKKELFNRIRNKVEK